LEEVQNHVFRNLLVSLFALTLGATAAPFTLIEGFDDVSALSGAGWVVVNNSSPAGISWFQGNDGVFTSQSGAVNSYVGANFQANSSTSGPISLWALSPVLDLTHMFRVTFYTRTETGGAAWSDQLEVYASAAAASTDVGVTPTSTGVFGSALFTVNPGVGGTAYPEVWNRVVLTLAPTGGQGRVAFRYVVDDVAVHGDYIGIDSLRIETVPEPATGLLLAGGLAGLMAWRRRRSA